MRGAPLRYVEHASDARTPPAAKNARCEAFATEARRGFSQVRLTQAYFQYVEEAEREKPRRASGSNDVAGAFNSVLAERHHAV